MKGAEAIKTISLVKEFAHDKRVIDDINLIVRKGELFCLAGANGAGKNTLI